MGLHGMPPGRTLITNCVVVKGDKSASREPWHDMGGGMKDDDSYRIVNPVNPAIALAFWLYDAAHFTVDRPQSDVHRSGLSEMSSASSENHPLRLSYVGQNHGGTLTTSCDSANQICDRMRRFRRRSTCGVPFFFLSPAEWIRHGAHFWGKSRIRISSLYHQSRLSHFANPIMSRSQFTIEPREVSPRFASPDNSWDLCDFSKITGEQFVVFDFWTWLSNLHEISLRYLLFNQRGRRGTSELKRERSTRVSPLVADAWFHGGYSRGCVIHRIWREPFVRSNDFLKHVLFMTNPRVCRSTSENDYGWDGVKINRKRFHLDLSSA
jgi:hypothetical protein